MKIAFKPGRIVVCALLAVSAPVLNSSSAQPGSIDRSFDMGTGADANITAITAARDGKLLIGKDSGNL